MRNGFGAEKGGEITSDEDKAYQKMKKKFWIAVALSIPVFVIAMSDVFGFLHLDSLAPKKKSWDGLNLLWQHRLYFTAVGTFSNVDGALS